MRLPKKDTATFRGALTSLQGFIGALGFLAVGLWTAVNGVEGCSEAIIGFVENNLVLLAGGFGVSSGAVSFFFNLWLRKDVKSY